LKTLEELARGKKYNELLNIYKAIREGKIEIVDPNPPKDYYSYLTRLDYSLWLWTGIALALLTVVSIPLSGYSKAILYLRYILGSIFVLFLPGYYTIEALYPDPGELSSLERLALSIGLSLALVPLIGLILNYTPWGIRLWPGVESLSLYTILVAFTAAYRKFLVIRRRLPE
jgi:uncharacterized membrane protein